MAPLTVNQLPLAPLGAGDLIDRTVRLYRRHFVALVRASAPPVVVSATGTVLWTIGIQAIPVTETGRLLIIYFGLAVAGVLLWIAGNFLQLIVMGGATRNLVAHLLWHEPVRARAIYRSVRARFWGLFGATVAVAACVMVAAGVAFFAWYLIVVVMVIGIGLLAASQGETTISAPLTWLLAALGALLFVAATIGAVWLFFFLAGRVAYVPQVMLVEGKGILAAISRSAELARGNVRRLTAMFLFTSFATYAALMLLLIPLGWYGYLNGVDPFSLSAADWPVWYAIGYQVVVQTSSILLTPVWMLGLSLLYVDERVRHEGYDIELMAARVFGEMPTLPGGRHSPLAPALVSAMADSAGAPAGVPQKKPDAFKKSTAPDEQAH